MRLFHLRIILVLLLQKSSLVSISVSALSTPNSAVTTTTTTSTTLASKWNKLHTALSSPSGKLTLSPEIIIPEPSDATSILLLTNSVQTLSERIRSGKANVACIRGSITALRTFTNEQSSAMGNFPGPVPTIYCYSTTTSSNNDVQQGPGIDSFKEIASAGADGVLITLSCPNSETVRSIHEILSRSSNDWIDSWQSAISAGLQPIPEIQIGEALGSAISEADMNTLLATFTTKVGMEPVAVVLTTMSLTTSSDIDDHSNNREDEEQPTMTTIPTIPKSISKRIPILGSIRAASDGENQLVYDETIRYKKAGYTGAFLRWDCIPGYQLQPNLELVGKFWFACITDLKSTRSKSFSFRAKNQMEVSAATKWGNYQKNVIESGALGSPDDTASLNDAAGDYQGF